MPEAASEAAPEPAPESVPESVPDPARDIVTWEALEDLVADLAQQLAAGPRPDVVLAISRGGLVPAGMLGYRLGWRDMLLAAIAAMWEAEAELIVATRDPGSRRVDDVVGVLTSATLARVLEAEEDLL